MKINCGSCRAKYTVADEKVHGKTVKIKCRKCGAVIVVSKSGEVETTGGTPPADTGPTYTVSVSDTDQRSMTMPDIIDAYNQGAIDADTYVWTEGMGDWLPLKDVDAVVDALHAADAAANAPAEVAPEAAPVNMGGAEAPAAGASAPAPAADPGGYPAPAAEAPAAAAPAAGSGGGGFSAAPDAVKAAAAAVASASSNPVASAPVTGDANSAIFSLDMLTAKVSNPGAGGPSIGDATGTSDDSGLIDLKALAASTEAVQPAPNMGPSAGVFPLGAPAVRQEVAASAMSEPLMPARRGGSKGLVVGLGVVIVALCAALVFFVVKGSGDGSETTASTAPTASATAEPTASAESTAEAVASAAPSASASSEAVAAASASASATTTAKAPTKVAGGKARPRPRNTGTTGGGVKAKPKPKPKPKPSRGRCNCKPSDLMCLMRCKG